MEKVIVLENEFVETSYVAQYKLAQVIWKKFLAIPSEKYREAFLSILDYTENVPVINYLADTTLAGVINPDDRKWFQNYGIVRAEKNGLKHAAIVIKKDPFKKYYMNTILKIVMVKASYDMKIFYSYEEALNRLLSFNDFE
ncbi:MAG: hypothetical protein JXR68_04980 [Bacteroidales bacterium]|nr:hypothetical protein [Bacteroidales bacterium]